MTYENAGNRIRDMEILIQWEGSLDNARLRKAFGVKTVQASRLLNAFWELRRNVIDRASPKAPLRPRADFDKFVPHSTPDDYLRLLASVVQPQATFQDVIVDARVDLAAEAPHIFALILQACNLGLGLSVTYSSMGNPLGTLRNIYPHSLVRAPRRWHVRAWCDLRKDFRDFTIGRIANAQLLAVDAPMRRIDDKEWGRLVSLVIVAHPDLNEQQQSLVQREYYPGKAAMRLKVRRALVGYVVQDLRLALDPAREVPPEFQLWLKNSPSVGGTFN